MVAAVAPALTFSGRLIATRPSTFLRIHLEAARPTPAPGEYIGRLCSRVGWRDCTLTILPDDASVVWCRPRPAAPIDVVGEEIEIQLTHVMLPREAPDRVKTCQHSPAWESSPTRGFL
jgi:hypothetical protein